MNMKFAALLLFVGVTSAEWCAAPYNTCSDGKSTTEATTECCHQNFDNERGCDVGDNGDSDEFKAFAWCCASDKGCTSGVE